MMWAATRTLGSRCGGLPAPRGVASILSGGGIAARQAVAVASVAVGGVRAKWANTSHLERPIRLQEGVRLYVHKSKKHVIVAREPEKSGAAAGDLAVQMHIADPTHRTLQRVLFKANAKPRLWKRVVELEGLGYRAEQHRLTVKNGANLPEESVQAISFKIGNKVAHPKRKWVGLHHNRMLVPRDVRLEIFNKKRMVLSSYNHHAINNLVGLMRRWIPYNKYTNLKKGLRF